MNRGTLGHCIPTRFRRLGAGAGDSRAARDRRHDGTPPVRSAGTPSRDGLAALWRGSLGSWYAFTSATLVRAIPLMLTGVAVAIAFRAGVLNIGAEGQLLAGARGR